MMSGACVGSFLVGATASCVVAGCVGSFLVGATASCAVAGCASGDSVVVAVFVVSSLCVSFICLLLVEGLVVVVAQLRVTCK